MIHYRDFRSRYIASLLIRYLGAKILGDLQLDMKLLKKKRPDLKKETEDGRPYYEVVIRVVLELMEGFRHTLKCYGEWSPEIQKMKDEPNSNIKAKATDEDGLLNCEEATINIAAHFEPSTA